MKECWAIFCLVTKGPNDSITQVTQNHPNTYMSLPLGRTVMCAMPCSGRNQKQRNLQMWYFCLGYYRRVNSLVPCGTTQRGSWRLVALFSGQAGAERLDSPSKIHHEARSILGKSTPNPSVRATCHVFPAFRRCKSNPRIRLPLKNYGVKIMQNCVMITVTTPAIIVEDWVKTIF